MDSSGLEKDEDEQNIELFVLAVLGHDQEGVPRRPHARHQSHPG